MHYHQIITSDTANGIGLRVSIFVSGCRHNCKGCHNKAGQNFKFGKEFTEQTIDEIIGELEKIPVYSGISILGGDPLEPENRQSVLELIERVRDRFPDKTVWLYTGSTWSELMDMMEEDGVLKAIVTSCDVIVEGPFVEELKDVRLNYRGSSNQNVVDVKKSLEQGDIVVIPV